MTDSSSDTCAQQAATEGIKASVSDSERRQPHMNTPGWRRINGRAPKPEPPINTPVLVVACVVIDPAVEIMAWTGDGWSNGTYGRWDMATNDGDHIYYWMPLPEFPNTTPEELWGDS